MALLRTPSPTPSAQTAASTAFSLAARPLSALAVLRTLLLPALLVALQVPLLQLLVPPTLLLPQVRLLLALYVGHVCTNENLGGSASASGSESGSAAEPAATGAADKASARLAGAGLAGLLAIFAL
jgi:uncharacterized protein YciW